MFVCSCGIFSPSFCTFVAHSRLIAPSFSFSSSESRLITDFVAFLVVDPPPNWNTLSLFFVAVDIGIGGLSCNRFISGFAAFGPWKLLFLFHCGR